MGRSAIDAKSALITALNDEDENVRWCAVKSLGNLQISDDRIINALRAAMSDDDYDVKRAASEILKRIAPEVFHSVPEISSIIAKLDSLTLLLIDEYQVPGVSIAIIKEREIFWSKGYGITDINKKDSVNNETIFEACSMSKPVFAYITLKLIEDGVIDIDTPLYEYLDESCMMNDPNRKLITARMVLCHSTGFPNWRKGEEERDGPLPILFKPGVKFGYSGEGMFYLQRVIEHITGEKLEVIADKMLFNPLGMHNTGFVWTEKIEKKLASGHDNNGKFLTKTKYKHANSAYSLYTTPEDYAKFIVEILDEESTNNYSLSKDLKDEMLNRQIVVNTREPVDRPRRAMGNEVFYGLGWRINSTMKGDLVCHSGANRSGFRCYSQFDFLEGSGLVIMTNGLNGSPLWRRLISEVGDL
jgi:CubicO group peptidase (beta-lactamase class C family)